MRQALIVHPDSRCIAVKRIEVDAARPHSDSLVLQYTVTGDIKGLRIPPAAPPMRTDELWKHTCFEAFVRASPGSSYLELNFSPSTQWAAYEFSDYRAGMTMARGVGSPRIDVEASGERLVVRAQVDQVALQAAQWRLGLSAVIEEGDGRVSYWALTHAPGKPDFHDARSHAFELRVDPS
jgi:hypothetical protein